MGDARLREIPNSKHQAPENLQIPIPKASVSAAVRLKLGSLEFFWCLELGSSSFPNGSSLISYDGSCHDALHHLAEVVREPEIASVVAVGQFLVVEPQQPQDRGVQVVHVYFILDRARAELIRRAVNRAAFDAAAG